MDPLLLIIIGGLLGGFFSYLFSKGKIRRYLILISLVIIFVPLLTRIPSILGYRWVSPLQRTIKPVLSKKTDATDPKTLEKPLTINCPSGSFCSNFSDKNEWGGWENFYQRQIDKVILIPQVSRIQDNPTLWFLPRQVAPNFEVLLKVAPQKEDKGNLVISFGDWWRCIVMESNYSTVACEGKDRKATRDFETLSSKGKKPVQPKTEISVRLISGITTNNKITITVIDGLCGFGLEQ